MAIKKISVENSLKNVTATLAFEGLSPSAVAVEMSKKVLEGKSTGVEARTAILNQYNLKASNNV